MEDSKMNGAPVANDGDEVRVKEEGGAPLSKNTSRSPTPSSAQSPAHLETRASSVSKTDVQRPELSPEQATTSTARPQLKDSPLSPTKTIKSRASSNSSGDAQRPRLSRKASRAMSPLEQQKSRSPSASGADAHKPSLKRLKRRVALYDDLPDVTAEACNTFQVIPDCLYGSKNMGSTENDALDCDCRDEWHDGVNHACGEDSDCINRATKMECVVGVGNHSDGCQNQRFQRKKYADVSVIKTEKKGHGLRSNGELQAHDFIFEYIGEVINEPTFRRRMIQYDEEGIKHFYFMSLTKSEFVDATKKGNLGRFCNHSCTPNCYVDKWVIGDKLRMGIFASRQIRAGEELVFNYNVDRYGADPQPCYCGEPNCTGFIGGKTQTERATKLPAATVEALGIDDGDSWDTAVAKKPRKKKPDEDDEEYVNSIQPRGLDEDDARKVMATLMQCKEKWIAVKLLERIQRCHDTTVITCLMRMHGYQIMKTVLNTFFDDNNVVLQVLHILDKFPRLTRNKIQDSKIETAVEQLANRGDHEEVAAESQRLLQEWSKLEMGYRIKRRKADSNAPAATNSFEERRNMDRAEPKANQDPLLGADVPKGPRSTVPQRNVNYFAGPRPFRGPGKKFQGSLPAGWFVARDQSGSQYFYDKNGNTTWQRPTQPAPEAPKFAEQARQKEQLLLRVIESVTNQPKTPQSSSTRTPQTSEPPAKDDRKEKKETWQSLPLEKQKKVFTNTIHPHIKTAIDRYQKHLSRDEYKYHFKEITKLIVANEYKLDRVGDPGRLSHDRAKKLRGKVREYMDKYLAKRKKKNAREEGGKAAPDEKEGGGADVAEQNADGPEDIPMENGVDDDLTLSDIETGSTSSRERKRKRNDDDADPDRSEGAPREVSETPWAKRIRDDDVEAAPPPPPPPPPPGAMPSGASGLPSTEEEEALREQEEALMRENEEAERMEAAERDMSAKGDLSIEKERRILNGEHPSNGGVIISGDGSTVGKEGDPRHDKGPET